MSNHVQHELLKLAAETYDAALDLPEHFTVADLGETLTADLVVRFADDHGLTRDLIVMTAHSLVRRVDEQRTKPAPQASLFDDLDRSVAVGDAERIARRYMRNDEWVQHLAHVAANAARVNASAAKENARYAALSSYLSEGMTTAEAVTAWQGDNPNEVLP